MLVDIPDDLVGRVVSALRAPITTDLTNLANGIEQRMRDRRPTEVTAETLTEDDVGRLMVRAADVPDAELRMRCSLWLDYPAQRGSHGPEIADAINRRAKAVQR